MAGIRATAKMPERWMDVLRQIIRNGGDRAPVRVPSLYDMPEIVARLCARRVLARVAGGKVIVTDAGMSASRRGANK